LEIVVASGKGGTGKTFISSNFSYFLKVNGFSLASADADVEAPDLLLSLGGAGKIIAERKYFGSMIPIVNYDRCIGCGRCVEACKFNAIEMDGGKPKINYEKCEGYGVCSIVCPVKAIDMRERLTGKIVVVESVEGVPIVTGDLIPGGANSGRLVYEVKSTLRRYFPENDFYIVDSAPGIGCPVISSISGADLLLVVVEPIPQSLNGAVRLINVAESLNVKWIMLLNKFDINVDFSSKIIDEYDVIGSIPYDLDVVKSYTMMTPLLKFNPDSKAAKSLVNVFEKVLEAI